MLLKYKNKSLRWGILQLKLSAYPTRIQILSMAIFLVTQIEIWSTKTCKCAPGKYIKYWRYSIKYWRYSTPGTMHIWLQTLSNCLYNTKKKKTRKSQKIKESVEDCAPYSMREQNKPCNIKQDRATKKNSIGPAKALAATLYCNKCEEWHHQIDN